jgi:DNA-directed RNA polymerase specialized sigma24 family protein
VDSETASWEALARRSGPALWRLASALAGPAAATGLVAEAFARAAADGAGPVDRFRLTRALWAVARPVATGGVTPVATADDDRQFLGAGDRWEGAWEPMPERWDDATGAAEAARDALASLRPDLRLVLTLRDREGWSAADVCRLFGIDADEERALLDVARWHVLRAIDGRLRARA